MANITDSGTTLFQHFIGYALVVVPTARNIANTTAVVYALSFCALSVGLIHYIKNDPSMDSSGKKQSPPLTNGMDLLFATASLIPGIAAIYAARYYPEIFSAVCTTLSAALTAAIYLAPSDKASSSSELDARPAGDKAY